MYRIAQFLLYAMTGSNIEVYRWFRANHFTMYWCYVFNHF